MAVTVRLPMNWGSDGRMRTILPVPQSREAVTARRPCHLLFKAGMRYKSHIEPVVLAGEHGPVCDDFRGKCTSVPETPEAIV
jgi:hypothetical protein